MQISKGNMKSIAGEFNQLPIEASSNIKIIANNNYQEFSFAVAQEIQKQIKEKPDSKLALPTGHSPRGCYDLLGRVSQKGEIDWRKAKCFALDDYLDANEADSFQNFLQTHLYKFTNLPAQSCLNPRFYDNYDQLITDTGGIDLCLLGLGTNGHIAFNEPSTSARSWTHCVFLTESTRRANKNDFCPPDGEECKVVPERAITMGITTILASKRIILAVSGEHKKPVLLKALQGTVDPMVPASYLTTHKNLLVITDFAFAL
jgi:glucosamine-6-phosphate deaminase